MAQVQFKDGIRGLSIGRTGQTAIAATAATVPKSGDRFSSIYRVGIATRTELNTTCIYKTELGTEADVLAYDEAREVVLIGHNHGPVVLISANDGLPLWRSDGEVYVRNASFSQESDTIWSLEGFPTGPYGKIRNRSITNGAVLRERRCDDDFDEYSAFAVCEKGDLIALANTSYCEIRRLSDFTLVTTIRDDINRFSDRRRHVSLSSSGEHLCVSGRFQWAVWNLKDGSIVHRSQPEVAAEDRGDANYRLTFVGKHNHIVAGVRSNVLPNGEVLHKAVSYTISGEPLHDYPITASMEPPGLVDWANSGNVFISGKASTFYVSQPKDASFVESP